MINHPEGLWLEAKKAYFPSVTGEHEKQLKILFMQGVWAGHELVSQGLRLEGQTCINFLGEVRRQINASLKELGHRPVVINLGTVKTPTIKTRINGEEV